DLYAHDERFHGELRRRAAAELRAHHSVREMKQSSGHYDEVELLRAASNMAGPFSTESGSDRVPPVSTASGSDRVPPVSTASGSDRVHANSLRMDGHDWEKNI